MKSDLGKLLMFVWMSVTVYFMFCMWTDLKYMTELVHAYISLTMEHIRN